MASSSTSGATEPSRKRHRRQGAAVVAPPPLSSSRPGPPASSSSSSSSSSLATSSVALTALPTVLTKLLDEFLGVAGRRPLAHTVSRALRETEAKKCTERVCLASPVPRACVDGCVLRGERLVAQAYALDASVTDTFRFRRRSAHANLKVVVAFVRDGASERNPETRPRGTAAVADGTMRITFALQRSAAQIDDPDARLTAAALEWPELYAPETITFAIVREITAAIADRERRQRAEKEEEEEEREEKKAAAAERETAQTRDRPLSLPSPRRSPPIDLVPSLKRLRSLYRPLSDLGRLMTAFAVHGFGRGRWRSVQAADDERARTNLQTAWRIATGRAFEHEIPPASEWLRIYPVPWAARVLRAVFRNGADARAWTVEYAHESGGVLVGRVPASTVGVTMRRLLSEPSDIFNELALELPSHATRVGPRDPSSAIARASTLLLRGIRVWRGSDIVASRFRVTVDEPSVDTDSDEHVSAVQAEFARLFPPQPTPFVLYGAPPPPGDEEKRVAVEEADE